ncbi:MAG TPA: type II secretion system protein GspM [Usitatibacter sp.]|jgi:general secretion pathway protein M
MSARQFWEQRAPGERRVLAIGAAAAALLLFIAFAWLPLERTRARLEQEVPRLRANVAALERDAAEAKRLRAMPPVATQALAPLAGLASTAPLPSGTHLTVVDPRHVRLAADDAAFNALVEWLYGTAPAQGLHVESARVEALPVAGRVRADITLAR